jgi:hypothetical protein
MLVRFRHPAGKNMCVQRPFTISQYLIVNPVGIGRCQKRVTIAVISKRNWAR